MKIISVDAPAKLNLYLHITDQRPNKLHELESLVVFVPPFDKIIVKPSKVFSLNISGPFANKLNHNEEKNLVELATCGLADLVGIKPLVEITLVKNLPVSAGLGGGSSDAAAILKALIKLWNVDLVSERISTLALSLGADVPMCLYGNPCFVRGVGEKICPAPALPEFGLLLVNPELPLATRDVFRARKGPFSDSGWFQNNIADAVSLAKVLVQRKNDLEGPAIGQMPVIQNILNTLSALPGCHLARMSGSGATCFGIFDTEKDAIKGSEILSIPHRGWRIMPSRFKY